MISVLKHGAAFSSVFSASDREVARERRAFRLTLALCVAPLVVFAILRWFVPSADAMFAVPDKHFLAVSLASSGALLMAIVLCLAAIRSREPRTFFLACTFLALAGPFSVHGLMTPGQALADHRHGSITVSAQLALILGAAMILLASRPLRSSVDTFIRAQFAPLMAGAILLAFGYILMCVTVPTVLDWVPTGSEAVGIKTIFGWERASVGMVVRLTGMTAGVIMSVIASAKFYSSFATTRSFATASVAIASILIGESLIVQTFGEVWHVSWWIYHVLLLIAVVLPMTAFALLYTRGRSLTEIVDSLFLTETLAKVEYAMPAAVDDFIQAVERRDPYLRGHVRRVCELSTAIADILKVPEATLRAASYAALLHDIGKLGLPLSILNKPGRLSDAEFNVLKEHPSRGFALVANIESLRTAAPAIRWHHERIDGTGYLDALSGNEIPIEARIVAVADVWDALTSDRVYRGAMTWDDAVAIIERERGNKLDAACVDALLLIVAQDRDQPDAPASDQPNFATAV